MKPVVLALALLVAVACPARADDEPDPPQNLVAVIGGPSLGIAIHGGDNGFLLGGEVSAAFVRFVNGRHEAFNGPSRIYWGGIYLDTLYDFSADRTRLSIGPELGVSVLGVDGGFVHEFAGDLEPARNGLAIRPVLTVGFATIYFRHIWFSGETLSEVGLMLKVGHDLYDSEKR